MHKPACAYNPPDFARSIACLNNDFKFGRTGSSVRSAPSQLPESKQKLVQRSRTTTTNCSVHEPAGWVTIQWLVHRKCGLQIPGFNTQVTTTRARSPSERLSHPPTHVKCHCIRERSKITLGVQPNCPFQNLHRSGQITLGIPHQTSLPFQSHNVGVPITTHQINVSIS